MNEVKIYNSEEFGNIRTVTIDNEPWFVGKDVATALGYADTFGALKKHIMDEDKLVCQIDSAGQKRDVTVINESGLYALIFGSKLESARRFKHWVTSEVLPAIRKTGSYQMSKPEGKELLAMAVLEAQKTIEQQSNEIERMKPKEIFADPVKLRPYRTFAEIEQPESSYVFHIKDGDRGPAFKLVEADGGLWKNAVMKKIKEYLEFELSEELEKHKITVIA